MKRQNIEKRSDAIAVVLGGGARRGQLLPGFLAWLDESKIDISFYLCVSIGAVVGALRTNGYTSEKIGEILPEEMFNTGKTIASLCDPVALFHALFGFDIVPQIRKFVLEHKLEMRSDLKLVAFDIKRQKVVIFEKAGCDDASLVEYDNVVRVGIETQEQLVLALAGSCCLAIPGIIRPVTMTIGDVEFHLKDAGMAFHPHPAQLLKDKAIVAKLVGESAYSEREGDFTVNLCDAFDPLFTSVGTLEGERMVKEGYERTKKALTAPLAAAELPIKKEPPAVPTVGNRTPVASRAAVGRFRTIRLTGLPKCARLIRAKLRTQPR